MLKTKLIKPEEEALCKTYNLYDCAKEEKQYYHDCANSYIGLLKCHDKSKEYKEICRKIGELVGKKAIARAKFVALLKHHDVKPYEDLFIRLSRILGMIVVQNGH